jgi:eukaryotic-like serine/threonine-protein kinase
VSATSTGEEGHDRRDLAERLFDEALSLPAGERTRFLESTCDDDGLRAELCELLAHADAAEGFFGRLADVVPTAHLTRAVIADRYEIQGYIGGGGMGAVYRAHDRILQRDVALKFLPPEFGMAPEAMGTLLREARAAAALEHANVCTVHEISTTEDGRPFISMAFYEGETLKERLRRGAIPAADAVEFMRQLALGLAAAHVRGIVHRDVKPGNVMLLRDGTVKLLDFGLARPTNTSVTRPGIIPGTIAYMSPEQVTGDAVDARSDLFSLGIVFHEMIAGVHPFRGGSDAGVIHAILHGRPAPLQAPGQPVPAVLERIVSRLLRKAPEERYSDAGALLADLEAASSTSAVAPTPAFTGRRSSVRTWLAAASGTVVVAASLIATTVASRRSSDTAGRLSAPPSAGADASATAKTIAVLPFTNLNRDPAEDYLVDGLTEDLIGALSQMSALRVVARTSAFAFRDSNRDVREIGRTLGVNAIVEGSVQRVGDRIRVRAQLINVSDGLNLWSEAYDRDVSDIFALQRDLSLRIASSLQAGLSPAERDRVAERPTASSDAYALYLKGRHFWNQRTSSGFVRASEYYRRAIEADSQFAAAWAGLAAVYSLQGLYDDLPSAVARDRMKAAATRAVELDGSLSEAHAVMGVYLHVYEWDGEAAEAEQLRAIELDPRFIPARFFYGNLLRAHGRFDEAIVQYRAALAGDPLDPNTSDNLATGLLLAGRVDESREHFIGALELDSMMWLPHRGLGTFYERTGRLPEALREYRRANELGGTIMNVARLLALTDDPREARAIVDRLQADATRTDIHHPDVALILYALHDTDGAMAWLEQSYRERHPALRFIGGRPEYGLIETEPQYQDLLHRIGLRR